MPKCIILRGLPGSGKSEIADFMKAMNDVIVCSADHHFVGPDGVYRFDRTQLREAHNRCFSKFQDVCRENKFNIVLDNTNTTTDEWHRYKVCAESYGYMVHVLEVKTHLTDEDLHKRNKHGVPLETIKRMRTRLQCLK